MTGQVPKWVILRKAVCHLPRVDGIEPERERQVRNEKCPANREEVRRQARHQEGGVGETPRSGQNTPKKLGAREQAKGNKECWELKMQRFELFLKMSWFMSG